MRTASATLLSEIANRFAEARRDRSVWLNINGTGVMIYGDVGGAAYIRADGSVFVEPWDDIPENQFRREDPGFVTSMIVVGAKKWPALRELLPDRPQGAADCTKCGGAGWVKVGTVDLVCGACNGLGWRPAA